MSLENNKRKGMLREKVLALVLVPLVVSSCFFILLDLLLKQTEVQANRIKHAKDLDAQIAIVGKHCNIVGDALVNYKLSADQHFLDDAKESIDKLKTEESKLGDLVSLNRTQFHIARTIQLLIDRLRVATEMASKGVSEKDLTSIWQIKNQIGVELRRLNDYEPGGEIRDAQGEARFRDQVQQLVFYGTLVNLLVAILLCFIAVQTVVKRLLVLKENYRRLSVQEKLLPPAAGNDEIAEIDQGFHDMSAALAEYVRKEQSMYENAKDIICSLDSEHRFLKVNNAAFETLGFSVEELIGRKIDDLLAPTNKEKSVAAIDDAINGRTSSDFETAIVCQNGNGKVLLWRAHWAERDKALFCVLHDVTELKMMARVKQDFVAMVSHDLRSPLMSVQATFELLEESIYGELNPAGTTAVKSSLRNLGYLLHFVEQILDVEKMESGRFQIACSICPVCDPIERATQLVADLAEKRKVRLDICKSEEECYMDEDRIVQVLVNLMSNALKYSPEGKDIKLSVERKEEFTEFRLSDHGKGIPENMRELIFDRFQQVSIEDWKEKKGTGLGLAICKQIVEAHSGQIGVESVMGEGSTFWFTIPNQAPRKAG